MGRRASWNGLVSRDSGDPTTQLGTHRAAWTMILVYLAGGLTALLDVHLLRGGAAMDGVMRQQVTVIAGIEVIAAAALWQLPWQRWPRGASLTLAVWALVLHAAFGLTGFMSPAVSVAFLCAGFVWLGMFHSYRATLLIVVPAGLTHAVPQWSLDGDPRHFGTLAIILPVWLLIAFVINRTVDALHRAHRSLDRRARLLEQIALAGHRLSRLDPLEVTAAALEALRGTGATSASLLLRVDGDGWAGHLLTDGAGPPGDAGRDTGPPASLPLSPAALNTLHERLQDHHSPGLSTLDDDLTIDEVVLPAGHVLAHAPVPTLGGAGSLVATYPPERTPGIAEQQAVELLATQTGQALSTANLFQVERRESRRHASDARRDGLTGIGNRRAIDIALADLRPGDVVVMLDLDRFKQVNDEYGHAAGDDTLRQLAAYLEGFARAQDTVGRYGGEEFTLLLAHAAPEADGAVARLLDGWRAKQPVTTLSAGYAVHMIGCTPQDSLAAADAALFRAKRGGRDRAVRGMSETLHPN